MGEAERRLVRLARRNIHLIVDADPRFPERLRGIPNRPYWLFVEGNPSLLNRKSLLSVVGTRDPSPKGLDTTHMLSEQLVRWGFVIVSGLAEGIDAVAHSTAIEFAAETVAVLGNGLDVDFPASNRELRQRILDFGGAVVSEYFPATSYSKHNFIHRNRIIAALSGATFPVESRAQSGTMHTIRYALDCNRLVIGVLDSKRGVATGNELPDLLRREHRPVIDLSEETQVECLRKALSDFEGDATPRRFDDKALLRAAYSPALNALRLALRRHPLDDRKLTWLLSEIARLARGQDDAD